MIIGHKEIRDFFDGCLKFGKISHAYCFVGPESVGKYAFAKELSAKILNADLSDLKKENDYFEIDQEIDEKTGKTKKGISVKQIRGVKDFLSQKSFVKDYKIVIINNADKLNVLASNALLKTLEEPRGQTVIFLITNDLKKLPETIISRCQVLFFKQVPKTELTDGLRREYPNGKNLEQIVNMSMGLPGLAINFLEDENFLEEYKKEMRRFSELQGVPFFEKLKIVNDIFGDKSDHIAQRDKINKILEIWMILLRDNYLALNNLQDKAFLDSGFVFYDEKRLLNTCEKILEAKKFISKNIHPKLIIENILISIK